MGKPLHELAVALPNAKGSEFLICPSAVRLLGKRLPGRLLSGGCVAMTFPESSMYSTINVEDSNRSEDLGNALAFLESRMDHDVEVEDDLADGGNGDILESVVRHMVLRKSLCLETPSKPASDSGHGGVGPTAGARNRRRRSSLASYDQAMSFTIEQIWETYDGRDGSDADSLGLEPLLRFMPNFVRQRCVSSYSLSSLTEHRAITVLFIIGAIKVPPPLKFFNQMK
jgi:hypothetical protein